MTDVLNTFLDKSESDDKDFRFMAMKDLMTAMEKENIHWDERSGRQALTTLVKLVNDVNTEVQNLAVECMAAIVPHVSVAALSESVEVLVTQCIAQKDLARDVATTTLKTVLGHVPQFTEAAQMLCVNILPALLSSLTENSESDGIVLDNLNLLVELTEQYSRSLSSDQAALVDAMLPLLHHSRSLIRKRASAVICKLGAFLDDDVFSTVISAVLDQIESTSGKLELSYVTFLSNLSVEVGSRVASFLPSIVPLLVACIRKSDEDDELKDVSFTGLCMCARQVPSAFEPYLEDVTALCVEFIAYDPNYDYDAMEDDDDDDDDDDNDFGSDDEDFSDGDFSDDDDVSWKVRRSAAVCLSALIITRHDKTEFFVSSVLTVLVKQLRERENNTLAEVMVCVSTLLKQILVSMDSVADESGLASSGREMSTSADIPPELPFATSIEEVLPSIISQLKTSLARKHMRVQLMALVIASELVQLLPASVANDFDILSSALANVFSDKAVVVDVKTECLAFIAKVVRLCPMAALTSSIQPIAAILSAAASDSFYKIVALAMGTIAAFVEKLRPSEEQALTEDAQREAFNIVFGAMKEPFSSLKMDVEVRVKSIECAGSVIAQFGDVLSANELSELLGNLMKHLHNDLTREPAANAITAICKSALNVSLADVSTEAAATLSGFLKLAKNPSVRNAALRALTGLFAKTHLQLTVEDAEQLVSDVIPCVSSDDYQASALAVGLLNACLPGALAVLDTMLDTLLATLIQAAMHRAGNKASLMSIAEALRFCLSAGMTPVQLNKQLLATCVALPAKAVSASRESVRNLAWVMVQCVISDEATLVELTNNAFEVVLAEGPPAQEKAYYLYLIGAVGISPVAAASTRADAFDVVLSLHQTGPEELHPATAHTLGCLANGSAESIQALLQNCVSDATGTFVLALRAALTVTEEPSPVVEENADAIWEVLGQLMATEADGIMAVVAESLAKLARINITKFVGELVTSMGVANPRVRSCAVNAVRYLLVHPTLQTRRELKQHLNAFLEAIGDEDVEVRRLALNTFKAAASVHLGLIVGNFDKYLELIYQETHVRKELIQEIQMGPFKHSVDRGADTRKAAFECLYVLLDVCSDRIVFSTFSECLLRGLDDDSDIQVLTCMILIKAYKRIPSAVGARVEDIAEKLLQAIQKKLPKNASKQESDKKKDVERMCMSVVTKLAKLPAAVGSTRVAAIVASLRDDAARGAEFDGLTRQISSGYDSHA